MFSPNNIIIIIIIIIIINQKLVYLIQVKPPLIFLPGY
jgi:hypothetical protein